MCLFHNKREGEGLATSAFWSVSFSLPREKKVLKMWQWALNCCLSSSIRVTHSLPPLGLPSYFLPPLTFHLSPLDLSSPSLVAPISSSWSPYVTAVIALVTAVGLPYILSLALQLKNMQKLMAIPIDSMCAKIKRFFVKIQKLILCLLHMNMKLYLVE